MEGEEEIPMSGRVPEEEGNEVEESNEIGETSFTERLERLRNEDDDNEENDVMDRSVLIFGGDNPDFISERFFESEILRVNDVERERIADTERKREILDELQGKEKHLEKVYGKRFRGTYGPNSKKLLKSLGVARGRGGNVTGLTFKNPDKVVNGAGVSVIVGMSVGDVRESTNVSAKFKQLVNKAIEEFNESADSVTYGNIRNSDPNLPIGQEILDEVRDDTMDRIESDIDDTTQTIREDVNMCDRVVRIFITTKSVSLTLLSPWVFLTRTTHPRR